MKIFLCLALLHLTNGKRCRGRVNVGSYGGVCNYETGQWRTNIAGYPHADVSGTPCTKEGIYLAWFNGEPIDQENESSQSVCKEKCQTNPDCDAWTLNTNNGWCALKRKDQVKEMKQEGFISGYKICDQK